MARISERQLALRGGDAQGLGNYPALIDYLNRRKVCETNFRETDVAVSSAQFALLNSTGFPGSIAVGDTTQQTTGGIQCASLTGAVGTAATTSITDSLGNITNLVHVREATNHQPIEVAGKTVFGLLQCSNTVTDGDAVGASGSENMQVSFVTVGSDSALGLVAINGTIEITLEKVYSLRHTPEYVKSGAISESEVVEPAQVEPLLRTFTITADFAADEVLTLSTGAGAGSGTSTATGDSITLQASASAFNDDNSTLVILNGARARKSVEAIWDSTDSLHLNIAMDVGDILQVETPTG